jgi:hypothetical protein
MRETNNEMNTSAVIHDRFSGDFFEKGGIEAHLL